MRVFTRILWLFIFLYVSFPAFSQDVDSGDSLIDDIHKDDLVLSVSSPRIEITSRFIGQDVVVFGALPRNNDINQGGSSPYSVVINIKGPREVAVVRKKERILGLWLNLQEEKMSVPSFAAVLSDRPIEHIASEQQLTKYGIGLNTIVEKNLLERGEYRFLPSGQKSGLFLDALLDLKQKQGLYVEKTNAVKFLSPSFFRAEINLPANVDVGPYRADLFVFKDGEFIGPESQFFLVVKEGFERDITNLANNRPLIYGILSVLIALIAGWGANAIMRN